ncbi:RWD-domain-containing protein [Aaosphaeria arxii CBS 175.79]|uniref:RWD-domain-containing protein n=1 Tax=Aaosphaeria arxii CBS 175.79 TaxID=1450172 RepID=A0A6A5Y1H0_9PLEO|nr:RWD-domain-containing protein [Aaosphaeria arxii CBS 175.79]KAF2019109.1 RWD-domain-containing protein [Aaosphaeria arxii CBS 175.79]
MGVEEQKEEREILESIYPDEITDISPTEYRISIALDIESDDATAFDPDDEDSAASKPSINLTVSYPPDYPDEGPRLDISAPPNAAKHEYLDVQEDKARLLSALSDTIEENLGMAMVFTLVSTLKEAAEQLIAERAGAKQAALEQEAARAEEEENRKFQGQAVTRESFLKWREGFRREMQEEEQRRLEEKEEAEKKKRGPKEEKRMSGKELWVNGLVGKGEDDEGEGDGRDALEGMEKLGIVEAAS